MTSSPDGGPAGRPSRGRRFAPLAGELARFGVLGVLNTVMAIAGTNVLHLGLGVEPLASNAMATVLATTMSFAGNRWWTFRHRRRSNLIHEYIVFFVLNGVGLLVQLLSIALAVYALDRHDSVSYNLALSTGVAVASLVRFLSYKKWVFLPPEQPAARAPAPARTQRSR